MEHTFGGPWTDDKLGRINEYLKAYMTIFRGNPSASRLKTYYVDAFAGTGYRSSPVAKDRAEGSLFEDAQAESLTRLFGTDAWKQAFYKATDEDVNQPTLDFDVGAAQTKSANFEAIGAFFVERLRTVFAGVAENPLPLRNSTNVPLYLLCFAAANPRGAPTAVRIANHILRP